jgi:hypothetical protein
MSGSGAAKRFYTNCDRFSDLIPYLPPSAQQFFMIYDEVSKRVESFIVSAFPADAALLLRLADTCFEVMVGLEHLPCSALP